MEQVHTHFVLLDWVVLVGYLLLTTWVGHALRGKQSNIKDFFLAGRSLPWPAVCGSIIATEISAVTFIGVPGTVYAINGNFTYLQWAIGSILARCIVGIYFVKVFYEREIYSPYDYMAHRLGDGVKTLTTILFTIGSILGQSVRVLVTALVLKTVTPLDMNTSMLVIAVFAIIWTLMGGMTTVIWTDVIQFFLFMFSGLLALGWILASLPGGWDQYVTVAGEAGKFKLFDWTLDAETEFTMWVALLAVPFLNLAAFGTDQLNAQRMFCCRNASDAKKAVIFSSFGQLATILMLMVGAALYVYYREHPPTAVEAALFDKDHDNVFPVWITTVLKPGLTGLVLAGAFAAAISSLDSALAALSQTTISLWYHGKHIEESDQKKMVARSRWVVLGWGLVLSLVAMGLYVIKEKAQINLLSLAFGMVSYTYGTMLAIFLLALFGVKTSLRALWLGLGLSMLLTLYVRPDLYVILQTAGLITPGQAANLKPHFTFAWLFPINCFITLACGLLFRKRRLPEAENPAV